MIEKSILLILNEIHQINIVLIFVLIVLKTNSMNMQCRRICNSSNCFSKTIMIVLIFEIIKILFFFIIFIFSTIFVLFITTISSFIIFLSFFTIFTLSFVTINKNDSFNYDAFFYARDSSNEKEINIYVFNVCSLIECDNEFAIVNQYSFSFNNICETQNNELRFYTFEKKNKCSSKLMITRIIELFLH